MTERRRPGRYPAEMRERAVRMVLEHQREYGSQWEAICSVAEKLGPTAETVRKWVRQVEVDGGVRGGLATDERQRMRDLEKENRALFAAAPAGARLHHVLLQAPFDVALERLRADPARSSTALSVQPEFLRSTHEAFAEAAESFPRIDLEVDTSGLTTDAVTHHVFALLHER